MQERHKNPSSTADAAQPSPVAEAHSTSINHAPQSHRNGRSAVVSKLLDLRVILPLIAIIILASRVVFLLLVRRPIYFKFPIIVGPFRRYYPPYRASAMDLWGFFALLGLVGYVGYRLGSPSGPQRTSSSPTSTSPMSPASNTQNTPDVPAPIDFAQLNEYFTDAIAPLRKLLIAGVLRTLVALHKGIVWLIGKMSQDLESTLDNDRNQGARIMDTKKTTSEDYEGYEMLPEESGSTSALEPKGSLSERKGKAKVGLEGEQL